MVNNNVNVMLAVFLKGLFDGDVGVHVGGRRGERGGLWAERSHTLRRISGVPADGRAEGEDSISYSLQSELNFSHCPQVTL